jgi:hypothetical protein
VSKHKKYTPKHRQPASTGISKKAVRDTFVLSSLALTGAAVGAGMLTEPDADDSTSLDIAAADVQGAASFSDSVMASRQGTEVSRSDRRTARDPQKAAALGSTDSTANAFTRTEDVSDDDPRAIARALLAEFGFGQDQFGCLDALWSRESGWRVNADNPYSSAYGIPQALPGSKMATAGADWAWNPETQIRWGLGYIADRYGSPCGAWGHSQGHGWY